MCNNWLTIGGVTIHGYGVMIAIGLLAAVYVGEKQAEKHGLRKDVILDLALWSVLIGFVFGSKLLYVIVEWQAFLKDPWSVLGSGGFVLYGGIIVGILTAWVFCRIKNLDFQAYFMMLVPEIALAQGFGRIGCFFAGCCYGMPTDLAIGVIFPEGSLAPAGVSLIPTQLISAAFDFCLFAFLYWNYNRGKHPADTGALYLIGYSIGRFLIEFLRADVRGSVGVLSTSQFIAIPICLIGFAMLYRNRKKQPDMVK